MYIDIKYLHLLSSRLDKFKQKGNTLWNFRCPVCGDSKKHKNKARGFVYQHKGELLFKCHNCGVSKSFNTLLSELDPILHKQYRLEKFTAPKRTPLVKNEAKLIKKLQNQIPVFVHSPLVNLTKIDDLNNSHPAREYLLNRKLPTEDLYYTDTFQAWVNSLKPDTFPDVDNDEPRIIIPFIDKQGAIFGFQGRSLHSTGLRYITILLDEGQSKIFGLNRLDYEKTIFITEGPFDSLLLDNAMAMAGADVTLPVELFGGCDVVYVLDNEPRSPEITKRIEHHVSQGHKVVIWPKDVKEKDINDMLLAGHDVQNLVQSNVYVSLTAKLKLQDWKQ